MLMDDLRSCDPNFKGCIMDFFPQPEEIQKMEAAAPVLPAKLSTGIRIPAGLVNLREAIGLITTAVRYTLHGIRVTQPDAEVWQPLMNSLRLQMATTTKLQEVVLAEALKIHPQGMRALLVKEQMPRTVAPFLQQFFRSGAGGDSQLSGMDAPASDVLGVDAASLSLDGGTPTRVPPGCAIIISPPGAVTSQQPGNAEQQLQQLQRSAAQAILPQPSFGQHIALPQYLAAPVASPFPGSQAAQFGEFSSPFSFPAPSSPRTFPFAASPFSTPFPYAGVAEPWAPPTVQGDHVTSPGGSGGYRKK
jgi:hypothetical protein